ncbi:hypothetical protein GGI35DRAFT_492155 [Trichoderma velutinum]
MDSQVDRKIGNSNNDAQDDDTELGRYLSESDEGTKDHKIIKQLTEDCQALFEDCKRHPILFESDWIEKMSAEFNWWSLSISATKSGHSSLDYRVQARDDVRDVLISLLDSLIVSLKNCLYSFGLDVLQRYILEENKRENTKPTVETTEPQLSDEELSGFYEQIYYIKTTLQFLSKITAEILRSGTKFRHQRIDKRLKERAHELEEFRSYLTHLILMGPLTAHLLDVVLDHHTRTEELTWKKVWIILRAYFMDANRLSLVQERLIWANLTRRNRFDIYFSKYCRKIRAEESSKEYPTIQQTAISKPILENRPTNIQAQDHNASKASIEYNVAPPEQRVIDSRSEVSSKQTATEIGSFVLPPGPRTKGTRSISTKFSQGVLKQDYPKCPTTEDKKFWCPYCAQVLDSSYADQKKNKKWRGHVAEDLCPYVCVYTDCSKPDGMYVTTDEWKKHLKSYHKVSRWICDTCWFESNNPVEFEFELEEGWHDHMMTEHGGEYDDSDLPDLKEASRRTVLPPVACPLCFGNSPLLHPETDNHIAEHLHSFALQALPWESIGPDDDTRASVGSMVRKSISSNGSDELSDEEGNWDEIHHIPDLISAILTHCANLAKRDELASLLTLNPRLINLSQALQGMSKRFMFYDSAVTPEIIICLKHIELILQRFTDSEDDLADSRALESLEADIVAGQTFLETLVTLGEKSIPVVEPLAPDAEVLAPGGGKQWTTDIKTHNEYTVGWVCALPKEQIAATAMLDQIHPSLPKPPTDSNIYTLGSIGKHNVVIACLPKGHIGNNSAATVAAQMVSTFPSVRFGLMVGIGGGIPPKVRLGDVVVGTPVDSFPGVIQWDLGKAKDGNFEWTGSLNNPPASLLTALAELESTHELAGSKIPEYLDQLKQKWPRLAAKYKSDSLEDILFKADYSHVNQSTAEDHVFSDSDYESEKEDNCQYCDKTKVIKRKPRDMRIHYGLIASGNQVIKSAIHRDQLNKDLGGNLLCVEMEAAGLMNSFPCIIIRGICDYADSHKSKDWQDYAAAVAAAFAKELLYYVWTSDVDGERPIKDVLGDALTDVSLTKVDFSYIKSLSDDLQILKWITSTDYGPLQNDLLKRRQPGTGQWLIDSTEYQAWLGTRKQTLFCPGIPWAGKTTLTSVVVDHLERTYKAEPTIGIAYIYCHYEWQDQVIERLLASLLKQLCRRQNSLLSFIRDFYEQHIDKGTRPSLEEIQAVLHSVTEDYSTVFIVVDALDECQNLDGSRQMFLTELSNLQAKYGVNLFLTSRFIPEIVDHFSKTSTSLEIRASTEDIERYLKGNMYRLPRFVRQNQELQQEIVAEISKAADGMFLLAQSHLVSLTDKRTPKTIRNQLTSFQKPISGLGKAQKGSILDLAYGQAMWRINEQQSGFKELALKVLLWIVSAERQLTATELQHALTVEIDELELDLENLPSIRDMVSACAGLVTVDYESNIIRLVHYTAQEYFNQTRKRWFSDADVVMADTCASYLLFKDFEEGVCATYDDFRERSRLNPLYDYAALNWGHHARKAAKLCRKVMEFLGCQTKMNTSIEGLRVDTEEGHGRGQPVYRMTSLHLAAYFGIEETVKAILKKTIDINAKDQNGSTPLSWSARNGHEDVVKLLLQEPNIEVNSRSGVWDETPLALAVLYKHEAAVELLLAAGANPNLGNVEQTPLSMASEMGSEAVVKLLLAMPSINVHSKGMLRGTALYEATGKGHAAVVKLLLAAGADPELGGSFGMTPLMRAAERGDTSVAEVLIAAGGNPDLRDEKGKTPLHMASFEGHESIVELLLAAGADANLGDSDGTTPLSTAQRQGHEGVVKLLSNMVDLANKAIKAESSTSIESD